VRTVFKHARLSSPGWTEYRESGLGLQDWISAYCLQACEIVLPDCGLGLQDWISTRGLVSRCSLRGREAFGG